MINSISQESLNTKNKWLGIPYSWDAHLNSNKMHKTKSKVKLVKSKEGKYLSYIISGGYYWADDIFASEAFVMDFKDLSVLSCYDKLEGMKNASIIEVEVSKTIKEI